MQRCPNCQWQIPDDAALCSYCGRSLHPDAEADEERRRRLLRVHMFNAMRRKSRPSLPVLIGALLAKPLTVAMAVIVVGGTAAGVGYYRWATAPTGHLWVTGHDADLHCSQNSPSSGAHCHYLQVAVDFVINGSTLPMLALDNGTQVHDAISNAFGSAAPTVTTVDPSTGFASLPLLDSQGKPLYSAIIIASDITCDGCDNNNDVGDTPDSNAINARAADIKPFFNAGGGVLALAGANNISVYYNFLPVKLTAIPVSPPDGSPGGFKLTSIGLSLGLIEGSDDNCCQTHNSFIIPPAGTPLEVAEVDTAGEAETVIIK